MNKTKDKNKLPEDFRFTKASFTELAEHRKSCHYALTILATEKRPSVLCHPSRIDEFTCIGMPDYWISYGAFCHEIKRQVPTPYHFYFRKSLDVPYCKANLEVRLMDDYFFKVCDLIQEQVKAGKDFHQIAECLNDNHVPCDSTADWQSGYTVRQFIKKYQDKYPFKLRDDMTL